MDNRYQLFLKERLRPGLKAYLKAVEQGYPIPNRLAGIPRPTFELLLRSFYSELSGEFRTDYPVNFSSRSFLEALIGEVDYLMGVGEVGKTEEAILANMPNLEPLLANFEESRNMQEQLDNEVEKWRKSLEISVHNYNATLIKNLETRFAQEVKSLPEGNRKALVKKLADAIQKQVMPSVPVSKQAEGGEEIVQETVKTALAQAAANFVDSQGRDIEEVLSDRPELIEKEIQDTIRATLQKEKENFVNDQGQDIGLELTARPQAIEEFAIRTAKQQVQKLEEILLPVVKQGKTALASNSLHQVEATVEAAIITNLPLSIAQNPVATRVVAQAIIPEIMFRIGGAGQSVTQSPQQYLTTAVQDAIGALGSKRIQETLQKQGITITPQQQAEILAAAGTIAQQVTPVAQNFVAPGQVPLTPVGGGLVTTNLAGTAQVGIYTAGLLFPEGSLGDVMISSGGPLHLFTSLASPRGIQDLGKYFITGGPIRSVAGFFLDSLPGIPKIDYLGVSLLSLGTMKVELEAKRHDLSLNLSRITGDLGTKPVPHAQRYINYRELQEVEGRLKIVNRVIDTVTKNPLLNKAYNVYFGKGRWLFHPIRTFQQLVLNKNVVAGLGVSGLTEGFFAYLKYGGYGGAYVTTEILKQWGILATKFALTKIGLYEIIGIPGHRHFVFKPTHEIAIRVQKWFAGTAVGGAIKSGITALLEKLGLSTILAGLSGGVTLILQAALWLLKKVWKPIAAVLGFLLFWLFSTFGPVTAILSLLGGFATGAIMMTLFPFAGLLGWLIGFFGGTIGTALGLTFLKGAFSSLLQGAGTFAGNLLHGLTGGTITGSMVSSVFPVMFGAGAAVVIPTAFYFMVISSAFEIPREPSPVQSQYIVIAKSVSFSGQLGDPINYTLTISATSNKITNIKITDTTDLNCRGTPPSVPVRDFAGLIPSEIATGSSFTLPPYRVATDQSFNDCLITNTAQVTADIPDLKLGGEKTFTANAVSIGNPPVVLPQLPLKGNVCLSGFGFNEVEPNGTVHKGIDIISNQTTVYSPFPQSSRVTDVCKENSCPVFDKNGNSISLVLGPYVVYMGHMVNPVTYNVGDTVPAFGELGIMGQTGDAKGKHVHYVIYKYGVPIDPASIGINIPICP